MGGDRGSGEDRAAEAEAALVRAGVVEVLDFDDAAATVAWSACDLASVIEGCFHRAVDPRTLDDAARERWGDRLGESYLPPGFRDDAWMTRYLWLLEDGQRVGTIALPTTAAGAADLGIWSLYVLPERRGKGVARRALDAAYRAAIGVGARGIRLDTHWVWQRALRFYLDRGMWVTGFKRSIELVRWSELPAWDLEETPTAVTFRVRRADGWLPLFTARRRGGRLTLSEAPREGSRAREAGLADARFFGPPTLAVALAMRGWPLAPSDGEPMDPVATAQLAALDDAIRRFESTARQRGWEVRTPSR